MNMEIGAEAALFPEKEYLNGIAVAVCYTRRSKMKSNVRGVLHYLKWDMGLDPSKMIAKKAWVSSNGYRI
jgi:hypothetical protein